MTTLSAWQASGDYFDTGEGRLFFRELGQGAPLLLLHGFPTSSWDWHRVVVPLSARYRVIMADKLGYGFSDKPAGADYGIAAHLDRLQMLLVHLGLRRVNLLCHDNGNTVAQEWLARQLEAPELLAVHLERVCFLNGGLFPETHRARPLQKLLLSPLGGLLARLTREAAFKRSLAAVFGPATQPSADDLAAIWALLRRERGHLLLPRHIRYISERRRHRARWVGALQRTDVPITLIDGVLDPVSGAHMVARFRELLPGRPVHELACGHFPQLEMPGEVLAALAAAWPSSGTVPN